jgi:hypothetical protein
MRPTRSVLVVAALFTVPLHGCSHIGPRIEEFAPARGPEGVRAQVELADNNLSGELLAVRDDGLLLRVAAPGDDPTVDQPLILVPYSLIEEASFAQLTPRSMIAEGERPNEKVTERLRLLSRFPQGLSDELIKGLLAAYGQQELEVLGP